MNYFIYTLRYLLAFADASYQEAYWDQVRLNDLWINAIMQMVERNKHEKKIVKPSRIND